MYSLFLPLLLSRGVRQRDDVKRQQKRIESGQCQGTTTVLYNTLQPNANSWTTYRISFGVTINRTRVRLIIVFYQLPVKLSPILPTIRLILVIFPITCPTVKSRINLLTRFGFLLFFDILFIQFLNIRLYFYHIFFHTLIPFFFLLNYVQSIPCSL